MLWRSLPQSAACTLLQSAALCRNLPHSAAPRPRHPFPLQIYDFNTETMLLHLPLSAAVCHPFPLQIYDFNKETVLCRSLPHLPQSAAIMTPGGSFTNDGRELPPRTIQYIYIYIYIYMYRYIDITCVCMQIYCPSIP